MELELYAKRKPEEDLDLRIQVEQFKRMIKKNYSEPPMKRFNESVKAAFLFPFEFIIVCLLVLVSPFHAIRNSKQSSPGGRK